MKSIVPFTVIALIASAVLSLPLLFVPSAPALKPTDPAPSKPAEVEFQPPTHTKVDADRYSAFSKNGWEVFGPNLSLKADVVLADGDRNIYGYWLIDTHSYCYFTRNAETAQTLSKLSFNERVSWLTLNKEELIAWDLSHP